jgi:hypothetical protein
MLAMSSIHDLVSSITLDVKISAIDENIKLALSKYCKTAIFHLVKINSSSVKVSQKYFLIVLSSRVKAYLAHKLFVLSNFRYPALYNLTNVVIVPSISILDLLLFNFAKNL